MQAKRWGPGGTAFGKDPIAKKDVPVHMGYISMRGGRADYSHASAPLDPSVRRNDTDDAARRDAASGRLNSREFEAGRLFLILAAEAVIRANEVIEVIIGQP